MDSVLMTSIVLKSDVTLMDVVSTRMLGQYGFLAKIFNVFKEQKISVDVVATSEIAVSLTLDPRYLPPFLCMRVIRGSISACAWFSSQHGSCSGSKIKILGHMTVDVAGVCNSCQLLQVPLRIPMPLVCSRLWTRGLIDDELDGLVESFEGIARVSYQRGVSILSLICNVQRTSEILERVRRCFPERFHLPPCAMCGGSSESRVGF